MFYQATDLMQQVFVGAAVEVDFSVLDDVILVIPSESVRPRFFNVAINKEEKMNTVSPDTCAINCAHESEHIEDKKIAAAKELIYYTVQCKHFRTKRRAHRVRTRLRQERAQSPIFHRLLFHAHTHRQQIHRKFHIPAKTFVGIVGELRHWRRRQLDQEGQISL